MHIKKQSGQGRIMESLFIQKCVSLIPRPHERVLLRVFDACESFRLGQSVGGSLNLIPTSSRPRTIAESYRYETKGFGQVRSHRLWASGQNGFTIGLGDVKRKGSPSNHQPVQGRMPTPQRLTTSASAWP